MVTGTTNHNSLVTFLCNLTIIWMLYNCSVVWPKCAWIPCCENILVGTCHVLEFAECVPILHPLASWVIFLQKFRPPSNLLWQNSTEFHKICRFSPQNQCRKWNKLKISFGPTHDWSLISSHRFLRWHSGWRDMYPGESHCNWNAVVVCNDVTKMAKKESLGEKKVQNRQGHPAELQGLFHWPADAFVPRVSGFFFIFFYAFFFQLLTDLFPEAFLCT